MSRSCVTRTYLLWKDGDYVGEVASHSYVARDEAQAFHVELPRYGAEPDGLGATRAQFLLTRRRSQAPYASVDEVDSSTRYDTGFYSHVSLSETHRYRNSEDVDPKNAFQSNEVPKPWPVQPQRIARIMPLRASMMVFDVILASVPIMFLALAFTAARSNGKEVSDYGTKLSETLLLSPTIFPLIFAALMGRFFKHLGIWLAQRGTTLGRLERLVGCHSVFSALERQTPLRSWSIVGLLSVLIWLLSPVDGQSALRLLGQETATAQSNATVCYMNPQMISDSSLMGASALNTRRSTFTSISLAALLISSKYQHTPMDLWENVKLPLYRSIGDKTTDGWKFLHNATSENITYACLIGIPVAGLPSHGLSTFNIKARQWDLSCDSNKAAPNTSTYFTMDATWRLRPKNLSKKCNGVKNCKTADCDSYPCPIVGESLVKDDMDDKAVSIANCDISFDHYEAGVRCNGTSCAVYKMRKLDLFDDYYTPDHNAFTLNNYLSSQMAIMPTLDNWNVQSAGARESTNMEKWIMDPSNFIGTLYTKVALWKLPPSIFSERFTILYNTFWQSTYGSHALGGNLPKNLTQTGGILLDPISNSGRNITFNATQAHVTQDTKPMYKMNWKWFTALLVSSTVLLIASYAGLVLEYLSLAPDIIGYASSLTLLNPYVPTPPGGSRLHGLERAALLRDMPVRIGDVRPDEPVGVVAFAKADTGRVARLDRQRLYI